jgi:hypothetical protein
LLLIENVCHTKTKTPSEKYLTSISYAEFQKLLNPAIPEKFKLIYEILYYYRLNIEDLLELTCDRVIIQNNFSKGIQLQSGKFIELNDHLFNRLINFLEFSNKPWGTDKAKFVSIKAKNLNFVFESNKKNHYYTVPTLYKKFKEHCTKVGILRDLALGSLVVSDVGRYISIINSTINSDSQFKTNLRIHFYSFVLEDLPSLIRFYILHSNYEEIISYSKHQNEFGFVETFSYPHIEIILELFVKNFDDINLFESGAKIDNDLEQADSIFIYGYPTSINNDIMYDIIFKSFSKSKKKHLALVLFDKDNLILDQVQELLSKEFRPWIQFIPLKTPELRNIELITTIEDFFISILDKIESKGDFSVVNELE